MRKPVRCRRPCESEGRAADTARLVPGVRRPAGLSPASPACWQEEKPDSHLEPHLVPPGSPCVGTLSGGLRSQG